LSAAGEEELSAGGEAELTAEWEEEFAEGEAGESVRVDGKGTSATDVS
jgi:hypothetical protein